MTTPFEPADQPPGSLPPDLEVGDSLDPDDTAVTRRARRGRGNGLSRRTATAGRGLTSAANNAQRPGPDLTSPELQLNRELSWLEFNRRVLAEAADPRNPLLERVKFLAIFGSNLDEFVMKRIGGLKEQVASKVRQRTPDGSTPEEQLFAINAAVRPMLARQRAIFRDEVVPALRAAGIEIVSAHEDLSDQDRTFLAYYFETRLFPILTPLAVDPAHPFPFISNLSISLAVAVRHPTTGEVRFARVKVPKSPRFIQVSDRYRFIPVEEVIGLHLGRLFPGMEVLEWHPFRVTRNADVKRDEERADDLLEQIQEELRERRFATAVRLVVVPEMPSWMRDLLCQELAVSREELHEVAAPLGFRDLFEIASLPLPELEDPPFVPVTHPRLHATGDEAVDIFKVISERDILVHHPYQSFVTSVQHFIERAAVDPQVLAIKQTLYRTSADSAIAHALVRAAENGKQVAVTIELKARFDEANNIEWASALEEAGAHVAYGIVGLKTHAKVALVVREEREGLRTYCHFGTGNYNAHTAHVYTDLGLFTANPAIGADAVQLFNMLTGYVHDPSFAKLLVAPVNMRRRFLELIAREIAHQEAGRGGRIICKMNSLEDPEITRALYAAGVAGVEIDLIVRGICRLRPGVPGVSETVRVRSLVGRFLEHARIFAFGNGGDPEYFLGSADWMARNLDYRVEAIVPVEDPELAVELEAILQGQLSDNRKAWELATDGSYVKATPGPGDRERCYQDEMIERAAARLGRLS